MSTINTHTTRAAGTILTAAIYNADHVNHISNAQNLNADKLEGATPPVVDGHAALWLGTTGAALKTAGYAPANIAITITAAASGGLTGGGDLSANRTLSADFADQATAEAGTSATKVMSPLRVRQWFDHANAKASQAEAEAAAEGTKWISPLRWRQAFDHANQKASQAEAEGGTNDTKWLSALRTKQAIDALGANVNTAAAVNFTTSGVDTGVVGSKGGVWAITVNGASALQVSSNGGSNYASFDTGAGEMVGMLAVRGSRGVFVGTVSTSLPTFGSHLLNVAMTSGAGNVFIRASAGGSGSFSRMI